MTISVDQNRSAGQDGVVAAMTSQAPALRGETEPPPASPGRDRQPARKVLMICFAFPPAGGPGVQRAAKLAKYLPSFGWMPIVWCADRCQALPRDESLLADLPVDLRRYDWPARVPDDLEDQLAEMARKFGLSRLAGSRVREAAAWRCKRVVSRLWHWCLGDPAERWARRSLKPLTRLAREERIDAIFSTFSPPANHELAHRLQQETGVPWLADFRDLWVDDYSYHPATQRQRESDASRQAAFLHAANTVTAVTPDQTRIFSEHAPAEQRHKFHTIYNGVDLADFPAPSPEATNARVADATRFTLTFTGWFLASRVDPQFLAGVEAFARALPAGQRDTFELKIVGQVPPTMRERLGKLPLKLTLAGYVPHDEAVQHMRAADVLLSLDPIGPNCRTVISGKIFEYLAAGRPILAIGEPDSAAARLLRDCDVGLLVAPDARAVQQALAHLYEKWRQGGLPAGCDPSRFAPYTRERVAGRFAELLDQLVGRTPACASAGGAGGASCPSCAVPYA